MGPEEASSSRATSFRNGGRHPAESALRRFFRSLFSGLARLSKVTGRGDECDMREADRTAGPAGSGCAQLCDESMIGRCP